MSQKKHVVGQFYVVTMDRSLYQVRANDSRRSGNPSVRKIEEGLLDGIPADDTPRAAVGSFLQGGTMVAICKFLMMYIPEGSGGAYSSCERRVESVNTRYWGDRTALVVGIFRMLTPATRCLHTYGELHACDPRWEEFTRTVLDAIGDEHPNFYVSHSPRLCLRLFEK